MCPGRSRPRGPPTQRPLQSRRTRQRNLRTRRQSRPTPQIVVSDGRYLAIQDLDLNNEDRVALDQTPFRLLLRTDVNLVRDARITELQESDDMLVLGLEDKDPNTTGRIKLYLATKPSLELKE